MDMVLGVVAMDRVEAAAVVGSGGVFADRWWLVLAGEIENELRQQEPKPEQEQEPNGSQDPYSAQLVS